MNTKYIVEFKEQMKKEFKMSDLGLLSYFIGIEVLQKKWRISFQQTTYVIQVARLQPNNFTNGTEGDNQKDENGQKST